MRAVEPAQGILYALIPSVAVQPGDGKVVRMALRFDKAGENSARRGTLRRILGLTLIVCGLSLLMSGLGAAFLH